MSETEKLLKEAQDRLGCGCGQSGLCQTCAGVSDRIDAHLAAGGWMPIESAPKRGNFLVYMPDEKRQPVQSAVWHPNIKTIGNHFTFDMPKATHWQPLPALPKKRT